jgi:hypothetical protein
MLLTVRLVPDLSQPLWKKFVACAFTGVALSSRLNYLLLLPPLFAIISRRSRLMSACAWLSVTVLTFAAVTVPFYWYDPAGFAPLYLHNKFSWFGEVPNGGILFPTMSALVSVGLALQSRNRELPFWLIQSGVVLLFPVVLLVGLATLRFGSLNLAFADYALPGVFLGGLGAGLHIVRPAVGGDGRSVFPISGNPT